MRAKIERYLTMWASRGYGDDIPDEVPLGLMREQLAPSYKAICVAILSNDHPMKSLGFSPRKSPWYDYLKQVELQRRGGDSAVPRRVSSSLQLPLFGPLAKGGS